MVSGWKAQRLELAKECRNGRMEASTKAIGLITRPMAKADSYTLTGMYTLADGRTIRLMGTVAITT